MIAIGFRREPHPPTPIVMPSRSSRTMSSTVARLSGIAGPLVALVDERIARLVRDAGEVELECEALLEAVRPLHVNRIDPVQRLLRRDYDAPIESSDLRSGLKSGIAQLITRYDAQHRAISVQVLGRRALSCVDHRAHTVLRHEPGEMRGGAERALLHLGQTKGGIGGCNDDVRVSDEADAAAQAEPVHRRDHGNRTLVDGGKRCVTAAVRPDERVESLGRLHLLDVDAGVEAFAFRAEYDTANGSVITRGTQVVCQLEPTRDGEGVDGWHVDDNLGDAVAHRA